MVFLSEMTKTLALKDANMKPNMAYASQYND
jgi:hypothetical protein